MTTTPSSIYEFGPFRIDPDRELMLRDGQRLAVTPKALEVLLVLVRHSHEIVRKEELIRAVWADRVVEEANLSQCIFLLRKLLGDTSGERHYIVTLPGQGYRFVESVRMVPSGEQEATPASYPASSAPIQSIAVLPFAHEDGDEDQQLFSDGLSESLINALSQVGSLKVISCHSAFQFRHSTDSSAAIGRKLGVAHLVEGSIRRQHGEVRITATLVNAADGIVVWSRRFDKPYRDLFALQDAITDGVAEGLKTKLLAARDGPVQTDRPPSGSLDAYVAYERGIGLVRRCTAANQHEAIAAFNEAIRLDPSYGAAYAQLSHAWAGLAAVYAAVPPEQACDEAAAAVDIALKLEPLSSLAHRARSFLLLTRMDWVGAAAEAHLALELAPHDRDAASNQAYLSAILGHSRQAVALIRQVLRTDPCNAWSYLQLGGYLAARGRLDDAAAAMTRAIAMQPGAEGFNEQLTATHIQRGDAAAALAAAEQEPTGVWRVAAMALALQMGPDRKAADAALQELVGGYADDEPYLVAQVYAVRRDTDDAFKWLDRAWTRRDASISNLLWDPLLLRYRDSPRFAALCKLVGLPVTTDAVVMK